METQTPAPPTAAPPPAPTVQPLALAVEAVTPAAELLGVKLHPYAVARKLLFHQILEGLATLKQEPQVTLQSWLFFRVLSLDEAALMDEAFRPAEFLRSTLEWSGHFDPEADDAVFKLYLETSKKRGRGHGAGNAATAAAGNKPSAPDGGGPATPLGH